MIDLQRHLVRDHISRLANEAKTERIARLARRNGAPARAPANRPRATPPVARRKLDERCVNC